LSRTASEKRTAKGPVAAGGSDPGRERDNNEDRILVDPERGIFAVVDGVGGESGGEVAAQTAVDVLRARLSRRTTDVPRLIREAIALANKQVYERAQSERGLAGMSCVLTVAVLDDGQATVGHVGDSRLYVLRQGGIRKVTRDHSPVGMREDAGEISELEAMHHPRRNEIFRDVGSAPHEPDEEGFIDIHQVPFDAESALLLCSDGLSDLLTSAQIRGLVEAHPGNPQAAVRDLIAGANAAGGKDNISVVLVEGERFANRRALREDRRQRSAPRDGDETAVTAAKKAAAGEATTERSGPRQLRGAARAKPGAGERILGVLGSWPAFLLYGILVATAALFYFRQPLRPLADAIGLRWPFGRPEPSPTLHVDPHGTGLRSIAAALEQAQAGQTIEVMPGDYAGPLELKDGVSLVSRAPRGAVIHLPPGLAEPAVTGEAVKDLRFSGFRIAGGSADHPLAIGLRLVDSAVEVENLEVSGADTVGIEIAGADRSVVRYTFIHDNPGTGVIVRDQAAPRLQQNLILRNGTAPGAAGPGVEIRDLARPQLIDNRIEGSGAAAVWVPSEDRVDEIYGFNVFGNLPRNKAVRVAPAPAPPAVMTPPLQRNVLPPPVRPARPAAAQPRPPRRNR
jgi:PPM family protein phosphatase